MASGGRFSSLGRGKFVDGDDGLEFFWPSDVADSSLTHVHTFFAPVEPSPREGTPGVIVLSAPADFGSAVSYHALGTPDSGGVVPGQQTTAPPSSFLVQFAADATAADKMAALASVGGKIAETVRGSDGQSGDLVKVEAGGLPADGVIETLRGAKGVSFAEVNWQVGVQATANETYYANGSMWGMYGDKTSPANAYGSQAGEAWAAGHTGKSTIVVGDIDTGVDYTHRDLYLNVWLNQSELPKTMGLVDYDKDGLITFRDLNHWVNIAFVKDVNANGYVDAGDLLRDTRWADGVDQNGNGYKDDLIGWDFVNNDNDPYDDNGHGTHTAGTIGATGGNGPGVAGVNWNVGIIALKFLDKSGSGSLDNAIKALDYYTAASASDQSHNWTSEFIGTNNSWGGGGYSDSLLAAIVRGAKQDALFIAAAGNGGSDKKGDNNDSIGNYPSNYSTLNGAGYEAVIAVSALTSAGALASYSNYGIQSVDLGAPGSAIWSTIPGGYASYSGTSMATPHVTGALALYASLHPDYTAGQLRAALLSSSDATASLAGKTVTGGRLNIGNVAPAANEVVSVTIDGVNDTDVLVGTSADDTINGLGGDDVITGGSGNDMIDGGTGVNTAVYTGAFKNYAVTFSKGSSTIGVHAKVGTDDIDTLNNIQKLQATDGTLDATWFSATAGLSSTQLTELTQLYIASFNRAPDAIGLAYWGAQLSGGMALSSVAASFFVQPEAAVAYPSNQPTQTFVNASYGNVLGRQADAAGLNYWVSQLDGGVVGKNTFVLALLNGAVGADVGYLANKVAVGQHFALAQGLSNAAAARSVMAIVSSQPSSVETANALTDLYAASASTSPDTELVVKILGIVD